MKDLHGDSVFVVIEDNNLNKIVFNRRKYTKYNTGKNEHYTDAIIQNVGKNKAVCSLFCDFMDMQNIKYKRVKPTQSKKSQEFVKKITGVDVKSQDARDALMLIIATNLCVIRRKQ